MQKIMYTVGLPASGKSFYIQELAKKERALILSSDAIRHEILGDSTRQKKTNLVYRTLYERANQALANGYNVIIDATNLERERRMFSLGKAKDVTKECFYFDTPYEVCLERNESRKRTVPKEAVKKMRVKLEFPLKGEGFDRVHIIHHSQPYDITKEELVDALERECGYYEFFTLLRKLPAFQRIYRFNQENPHHELLLCQHTYSVLDYINHNYGGPDKLAMQLAAVLHDVEKPFCKVYKPLRNAYSYFGHENVSAQTACHFLTELGFDEALVEKVVQIVQLHMLIQYGGNSGASEIYHLVGADMLTNLYEFRRADRSAKQKGEVLMTQYYKYPRSFHLPWSRSYTHDDKVLKDVSHFIGKEVVVTEKLDGEGSTLYRDHMHARSIFSGNHESRHWLKQYHSTFSNDIPEDWRICGENVYAKHSIAYSALASYFYAFSVWNEENQCLSWDETEEWCSLLGIETVPVLYRGIFNEKLIHETYTKKSKLGGEQEGYVIRLAESFHYEDFSKSLAKFVRKNHVQTDAHWMHQEVKPNQLK